MEVSAPSTRGPLTAAVLAALAASVCCLGPIVLVALGASGAFVSSLRAFEPFRPWLTGATALVLGLAFWRTYRRREAACADGAACARTAVRKGSRVALWSVTALVLVLLAAPTVLGAFAASPPEATALLAEVKARRLTLAVSGMTCGGCVATVKSALEKVPGVSDVRVSLEPPRAVVVYDAAKTGPEALKKALEDAGYTAERLSDEAV